MRTRIISAFPGTGKSYYCDLHPNNTLDSDSSHFSWLSKKDNIRNPAFPDNYIKHIRENIGKYEFIFVSTHKVVREALLNNCIHFYLIYPNEEWKDLYLKRFKERGSSQEFIDLLDKNWDAWIRECEFTEYGCTNIHMVFPFLEKEINHIIYSENGDEL